MSSYELFTAIRRKQQYKEDNITTTKTLRILAKKLIYKL